MSDESRSLDVLGIKPVADAFSKITTATVDGVAAFLSRICLPAAEEFGLLLRDRLRVWRSANIAAIAKRAEECLNTSEDGDAVRAHPRLVANILEEGSWIEDPVVQDLWGGLLSSSCTDSGNDDSNLLFINLLSGLTKLQARILKYVCENARKRAASSGLIVADQMTLDLSTMVELTSETDIHRLDRELDHLRECGLIDGGFPLHSSDRAMVGPTAIALHMYVRCEGSRSSPIEYFGLDIPQPEESSPTDSLGEGQGAS